ncbi:MAG: DNA mismatch repair protein MutS, partial [Firmicutes bacterium]|nr:DNA mismatch repair protein MutS [Bacillota bacterium]
HVAKIAGVPKDLLDSAEEKLEELESGSPGKDGELLKKAEKAKPKKDESSDQLSFFGFAPNPIVEQIKELDLMNITPSQAFVILEELKKAVQ